METTTKILNTHEDKELEGLSLEKLSSLYRQTHYDCIVAEAFEKVKRLIVINNRQYPQFEIDDCISFALEKLTMCLSTYVPGSSNKFSTYFAKVYRNELRRESQQRNTHKRCIMYNSTSLDYLMEEGFDVTGNKNIQLNTVYLPSNLTEKEKLYCKLIMMDYGSNKDMAEYMNVSVMTLCNMRKSLRIKLKNFYN